MARDLTLVQFKAALARNGFRSVLGLWAEDISGKTPGRMYSFRLKADGSTDRRKSLAYAINRREVVFKSRQGAK